MDAAQSPIGTPNVAAEGDGPPRGHDFRVLAVMPAYNEADIIFSSVGALVGEGVDIYLLDHGSTDGTVEAVSPWLGHGLWHIERFPDDAGYPELNRHALVWRDLMRRIQEVTGEVQADWYIFANADEFREAPWRNVTLTDALREVDELGFTAVNFEWFDFQPVDDLFEPGGDPRVHLRYYAPPPTRGGGLLQVKAWKRPPEVADLVSYAGHDVQFEGKRVFPIPFILRHYPLRSSIHGARKVQQERLPRYTSEERAMGWHVHYDDYAHDRRRYLRDPATLTEWNGDTVRAQLLTASMHQMLLALCVTGADPAKAEIDDQLFESWLVRRGEPAPAALQSAQERLDAVMGGARPEVVPEPEVGYSSLHQPAHALDSVAADLALVRRAQAALNGRPDMATALEDAWRVLAGRSLRTTGHS
jgi:hypothetical protein